MAGRCRRPRSCGRASPRWFSRRFVVRKQQQRGRPMDGKKVALVTGANKGIGFEISRQLGRRGFTVVLAGRDAKKVADAAARLQTEGLDAHGVVLDVANPTSAQAAAKWLDQHYGRLDVLVNNAGVGLEFAAG